MGHEQVATELAAPVLEHKPENNIPAIAPIKKNEVAKQETVKFDKYEIGGLAFDSNGQVAIASLIDMILVCLAVSGNEKIAEVLKANSVQLRDVNGVLIFPTI